MDAFWCIVLSAIVLRAWWVKNRPDREEKKEEVEEKPAPTLNYEAAKKMQKEAKDRQVLIEADEKVQKAAKEAERQRDRDINELRKQGYTDDLIAMIIPTINNGQ